MAFIGIIAAVPDPPGVSEEKWIELIATHPSLSAAPAREGINPFTREPVTFRPNPRAARVHVGGRIVGGMSWAQDDTNEIVVSGDDAAIEAIATELASLLGAVYRRLE